MSIKLLWYLTAPDGPYPWEPEGRWRSGFDQLRQVAVAADRLGFYGSLLGTGPNNNLVTATALIEATERLRFVVAQYPGELSPAVLAHYALTFDKYSGGRLLLNLVNGNDDGLASLGVHFPHDERYQFSRDYWRAFQHVYSGNTDAFDSQYIKLAARDPNDAEHPLGGWNAPTQQPGIAFWGAGTSPAGVAHSVELLDVYLSFADTPARLGDKFRKVAAEAAKLGRTLSYGTRLQIIVRETEAEAWAHAERLLARTSLQTALDGVAQQLPPGQTLHDYRSDEPRIQRSLDALKAGRLPALRDLEVYPNVWTGPSLFGFDILRPGSGTYLVGSAEQVAERLREYQREGVSAFILSGFPLVDEAQRVADLLFPLLDLDHGFDVPVVAGSHRQEG